MPVREPTVPKGQARLRFTIYKKSLSINLAKKTRRQTFHCGGKYGC